MKFPRELCEVSGVRCVVVEGGKGEFLCVSWFCPKCEVSFESWFCPKSRTINCSCCRYDRLV
jgi:hypothetical protein